jgi:hypothetical protein
MNKYYPLILAVLTGLAVHAQADMKQATGRGGVAMEAAQATAFSCVGRVVKTAKKSTKKSTDADELAAKPSPSYLAWSCRTQAAVQRAFDELRLPATKPPGPASLEDAMHQAARINTAAGETLNKTCDCSFEQYNEKTKKPMIACGCAGTYQESKNKANR